MAEERIELILPDELAGSRLDGALAEAVRDRGYSRSRIGKWIADGAVCVNGRAVTKTSYRTESGDRIEILVPETVSGAAEPEDIPLEILYEDDSLAVIVKPSGMVVHPAAGNPDHTLVNSLLFHLSGLSGIGGEMRPGIVHRLDKDTSGVMLVAKNDAAHVFLAEQLAERKIEKHYRAVVQGKMPQMSGVIDRPIARSKTDRKKMAVDPMGKEAVTEWTVIGERGHDSFLDVHILTGRTHQIRVHMQSIGHPVLGDPIYGKGTLNRASRLMLHAFSLSFTHPVTRERMFFTSPCPF